MDVAKSVALIDAQGTDLERARVRYLLYKTPPEESLTQAMTEIQNIDGGFPHAMVDGNLSAVDTTLDALWWMDELGLLESVPAEKATNFLFDVQDEDGAWDEDRAIQQYALPPWIKPGRPQTIFYLTARVAFWLARLGLGSEPASRRAVAYLAEHQEANGKYPGNAHTTWIAGSVFLLQDPDSGPGRKCLQFLKQKPAAEWADSQLAWMLNCLHLAGLKQDDPLIDGALRELARRRTPEGGWSSEWGPERTVEATIEALRALQRYGLLEA